MLRDWAVERLRQFCAERGLAGVVLGTPAGVAWVTGGANRPIDRGAAVDVIWVAVGPDRTAIVTTIVEAPRVRPLVDLGTEVRAVDWWDSAAFERAALEVLGGVARQVGTDLAGFGRPMADELVELRLELVDAEVARLRAAGRRAAASVEGALAEWRPGEIDFSIAARIESSVVAAGGDCPVVIVGGDDRVRSYRHPLSVGAPVTGLAMAVLVARFDGFHVALTRFAATSADTELETGLATVATIRQRVLDACRPGARVGDAMAELDRAYADAGHAGEWRAHYQGGPIGYAQREFEISPAQSDSSWWDVKLPSSGAYAWNPSLPGGAKDEDTYLITRDGIEVVTAGSWPRTAEGGAAVLLIAP